MRGFVLLQKSFSHIYILAFLWSSWSYPEWNEWKYVSVVEQIGLNVLNAKCLETGILSRDNPPRGLNTVSQELTQTQEFLEPKSIITLHLLFQEMVNSKMSVSITMSPYRTLLQSTSWLPLIQVDQWVGGLTLRTSMDGWLTAGQSRGGVTWTLKVCWVSWCRRSLVSSWSSLHTWPWRWASTGCSRSGTCDVTAGGGWELWRRL